MLGQGQDGVEMGDQVLERLRKLGDLVLQRHGRLVEKGGQEPEAPVLAVPEQAAEEILQIRIGEFISEEDKLCVGGATVSPRVEEVVGRLGRPGPFGLVLDETRHICKQRCINGGAVVQAANAAS